MRDPTRIPAASLDSIDLEAIRERNPRAAQEIAELDTRLDAVPYTGADADADLRRLARLLVEVDEVDVAEYLLRRNLEAGDLSYALYIELFGTEKEHELDVAVDALRRKLGVELRFVESRDYLHKEYEVIHSSPEAERQLGFVPTTIEFDYSRPSTIGADVQSDDDDYALLRWTEESWVPDDADETTGATRVADEPEEKGEAHKPKVEDPDG